MKEDSTGCIGIIVIGLALYWFLPNGTWDSFHGTWDRFRYSFQYNVPMANVERVSKPTDCDWDHAPLGLKDCHYVKQIVFGYDPEQELVDRRLGDLLSDPSFFAADPETRRRRLHDTDPAFRGLPEEEQRKVINRLRPDTLAPKPVVAGAKIVRLYISWTKVKTEP